MTAAQPERPDGGTLPEAAAAALAEARRLLTAVREERAAFREEQEALRQTLVACRHELTALPESIGAAVDSALTRLAPDFRTLTAQLQALTDTGALRPPPRPPVPSPGRVFLTVGAILALVVAAVFLLAPDPQPPRSRLDLTPLPPPRALAPAPRRLVPVPPPAAPPEEGREGDA